MFYHRHAIKGFSRVDGSIVAPLTKTCPLNSLTDENEKSTKRKFLNDQLQALLLT